MPRVQFSNPVKMASSLRKGARLRWQRGWSVFYSQMYNDHFSLRYVADIILEPIFRLVDGYMKFVGPAFTSFLITMMALVILLCYLVIVPYEWVRMGWLQRVIYLTIGHWLLVNALFHYFKAWLTRAGSPRGKRPPGAYTEASSFCKQCIAPKPPRAHHCRICGICILRMDHHCPWLNQCVGHYNHRYFFLSMAYMLIGCLYIVVGSWSCFMDHFYNEPANSTEEDVYLIYGVGASNTIQFTFFVAFSMVIGMLLLLAWHAMLITNGETSIEQHVNDATASKMAKHDKKFYNIFNFGIKMNWVVFLGLDVPGRSFWRHVLLPSTFPPYGDGYSVVSFMPYKTQVDSGLQCVTTEI